MRWWKLIGLAGLAGVAATGVVIARAERRRRAYTPEEVRARLHVRATQAAGGQGGGPDGGPDGDRDGGRDGGRDGRDGGGASVNGRRAGGTGR